MRRNAIRTLVAAGLLGTLTSIAQTPARLLPFQARLTDAGGKPLADGVRAVQFQIFGEPAGGTPLWAGEVHRATINGGLINVLLGSRNPLPVDHPADPARSFFDTTLYLQVTPDANLDDKITDIDPPLLPRQAILPAVFATETGHARNADRLAGRDWSDLLTTADPRTGQLPADLASIIGSWSQRVSKLKWRLSP